MPGGLPGYLGRILHPSADISAGTCFQLAPGVLATAFHVLQPYGPTPGAVVRFAPLAGGPPSTATVERVDQRHDLAVLRTDSPLPACVRRVVPTETELPGLEVIVEGFGDVPEPDGRGYRHMLAIGEWQGVTERDDGVGQGVRRGRFNSRDGLLGMSGAPVRRRSDDAVVGVVSARYNSADGRLRDTVWTAWTEDLAALAPRELSWFSPHLRTHEQVLRDLHGKEQYLTTLDYVSPDSHSPASPTRLMDLLDAQYLPGGHGEPRRGVLLEGAAGAGKTRTCHEVAERALRQQPDGSWLVLHAESGSAVTAEHLVQAALAHARVADAERVLLVLDYLDSYSKLSLSGLQRELQTQDQEGRVACLASARPGALPRSVEQVFTPVSLEDGEEYRTRVASAIFQKVAPGAWNRWGRDQLVALCSDRPVFALLIGRALEEQAKIRRDAPDLSGLRRGELFGWLWRQLERDFHAPTVADRQTGQSRPAVRLLASSVAVLACPQDESAVVESAVGRALDNRADTQFAHSARDVVVTLHRQSWLVGSGDRLELVHDIVADGLLDATLTPRDTFQSRTAEELLDALCDDGPVFAQAVRHLARWTTDQPEHRRADTEAACAAWLEKRADQVRDLLTSDAGAVTAFDLMAYSPWQAGVIQHWDELVEPWLGRISGERPAALPEALAPAVDKIDGPVPRRLLDAALTCLESQPQAEETGLLLQALVHAEGLERDQLDIVASHVQAWAGRHKGDRRSVHLLGAALSRQDLTPQAARPLVKAARQWIRRNPAHPAGSVVLAPLLIREEPGSAGGKTVIDAGLTWVVRQAGNPGISFVLKHVLRRTDLGRHRDRAVGLALAWLRAHQARWSDQRARRRAHHSLASASFVLRPLLRMDLAPDEARETVRYTKKWLDASQPERHVFVLGALVRWDEAAVETVTELLLSERLLPEDRRFLLQDLLREDLPQPLDRHVVDATLDWLRDHGTGPDSLLHHLLLCRIEPDDDAWAAASRMALRWLKLPHGTGADASFLLDDLLTKDFGPADTTRLALDWLELPGADARASYVLRPLLWNHGRLGEDSAARLVDLALSWIRTHAGDHEAGFVLEPLLLLRPLDESQAARAVQAADTWLRAHGTIPSADRVRSPLLELLERLLAKPGPGPRCAVAITPATLHHARQGRRAVPLLIGLLYGVPSGTRERTEVIDGALDWLAQQNSLAKSSSRIFKHLFAQRDLDEQRLARGATLFLERLGHQPTSSYAALPLAELLRHTAPAPWRATAVTLALSWLSENTRRLPTGEVLATLLLDPDPPGARRAEVRDFAAAWLEATEPGEWRRALVIEALAAQPRPEAEAGGGPLV